MTQRLSGVVGALALAMVMTTAAHARTSAIEYGHADDNRPRISSANVSPSHYRSAHRATKKSAKVARVQRSRAPRSVRVASSGPGVVGGRPAECRIVIRGHLIPFCGCALSVKLFGYMNPALMLADNWRRLFPRAARPEPGMVAARSGHVFQLVSQVSGNRWIVWDANSGGGLTRIHERSIAGYTIVDPRGSRVSAL